jgi:hypothetical protein
LLWCSVRRLEKKLGPARVEQCVEWLRAADYAKVARALLQYYDRLYDVHVSAGGYGTGAHSGGTAAGGGGTGRSGVVLDAQQPEALQRIDPVGLARAVLARVADFEQQELR